MADQKSTEKPNDYEAKLEKMFEMANKKIEDMLADAEKKAAKIIDGAEKTVAPVRKKPIPERMVSIRLPRDPQKGDRIVSVNGKTWVIQRGVNVEIPLSVWEVIENSDMQDDKALQYREQLQNDFAVKLKQL